MGKELADCLENGTETGIPEKDIVIFQIPQYEIHDKSIELTVKSGKGDIPILIKPDSTRSDYRAFYEYKQGDIKYPWTQKKVDNDDQMTFYSTGLYEITGYMPESELIWAVTEKRIDPDGIERPHYTGEIRRFKTKRTLSQILKMKVRMSKAWKEIGKMMEEEIL